MPVSKKPLWHPLVAGPAYDLIATYLFSCIWGGAVAYFLRTHPFSCVPTIDAVFFIALARALGFFAVTGIGFSIDSGQLFLPFAVIRFFEIAISWIRAENKNVKRDRMFDIGKQVGIIFVCVAAWFGGGATIRWVFGSEAVSLGLPMSISLWTGFWSRFASAFIGSFWVFFFMALPYLFVKDETTRSNARKTWTESATLMQTAAILAVLLSYGVIPFGGGIAFMDQVAFGTFSHIACVNVATNPAIGGFCRTTASMSEYYRECQYPLLYPNCTEYNVSLSNETFTCSGALGVVVSNSTNYSKATLEAIVEAHCVGKMNTKFSCARNFGGYCSMKPYRAGFSVVSGELVAAQVGCYFALTDGFINLITPWIGAIIAIIAKAFLLGLATGDAGVPQPTKRYRKLASAEGFVQTGACAGKGC